MDAIIEMKTREGNEEIAAKMAIIAGLLDEIEGKAKELASMRGSLNAPQAPGTGFVIYTVNEMKGQAVNVMAAANNGDC